MDIRIAQGCPQCGASVVLPETDHVMTCLFCGTSNLLQSSGPFRYVLPMADNASSAGLLLAPYLRFKGTVYLVTGEGIEHRVIDTTQAANPAPGLPPSLGLRPQAMQLSRIDPEAENLFLPQTVKPGAILEKAAAIGKLTTQLGENLFHRAYIGENCSYIYLPLVARDQGMYDGVTDTRLIEAEDLDGYPLVGKRYDEAWKVHFLATLCPQCGAGLEGAGNCQVMVCTTCHTAWAFGPEGLKAVDWRIHTGDRETALYLPFWKIATHIPALDIYSFADFVERSNQPFLPRPQWHDRVMSLWIPAVKLRPKIFLQVGRQVTLGQCRLKPMEGRIRPELFPVTLPSSEARQAVKLILAAATASPKRIFPHLPQVRLTNVTMQLVYLPFVDKGHDWMQPETGVAIGKNILRFGQTL
jgi:ribosomal protein S27AE